MLCGLCLAVPATADGGRRSVESRASTPFGRWEHAIVDYHYNPSGAPDAFRDRAFVESMIQQAAAEWEGVSGIAFNYRGTTTAPVSAVDDGTVVIGWSGFGAGGAAGRGGPASACTTEQLRAAGYCRFVDGSVQINRDRDWGDPRRDFPQRAFVRVLVHELGHLIGLAHSNDPGSIMFASPYNNLSHPRPSDVEAASALYGPPLVPSEAAVYSPPAVGSDPLFIDAGFVIDQPFEGTPVTGINYASTGGQLWFTAQARTAGVPLNTVVDAIVTDPSGYFYSGTRLEARCPAHGSCMYASTVATLDVIATVPGTWTAYLVRDGLAVLNRSLEVSTRPSFNSSPIASLDLPESNGTAPLTIRPRVRFKDLDGDDVTVVWHVPGSGQMAIDTGRSSGSEMRHFVFEDPGIYPVWVEVNDDVTQYGGSGTGFQTLLTGTIEVFEGRAGAAPRRSPAP